VAAPATKNEPSPKLIIGYDGRSGSEDALALGADLCRLLGARPVVLSVAPWPRFMHGNDLKVALELDTGEDLKRACDSISGLDPIAKAVVHRSAAEEIGMVAKAEQALAIVVGASHRGTAGQILLGSIGASLLHGAPCAVAVAPKGYADSARSLKSIAVALDDSPEAAAALDSGITLARRAGGTLTLLSVAETDFYVKRALAPGLPLDEMTQAEREYADRILESAVAKVPDHITAASHRLEGSPRDALPRLTGEYDLMIAGSRGYGPLGQTVLGSVSAALIDGSRCPVLILPRGKHLETPRTPAAGAVELSL
jgi:nucleotide-binding universal stress UspA family protein